MFTRLFGKPKQETNALSTLDKLNEVKILLHYFFFCLCFWSADLLGGVFWAFDDVLLSVVSNFVVYVYYMGMCVFVSGMWCSKLLGTFLWENPASDMALWVLCLSFGVGWVGSVGAVRFAVQTMVNYKPFSWIEYGSYHEINEIHPSSVSFPWNLTKSFFFTCVESQFFVRLMVWRSLFQFNAYPN